MQNVSYDSLELSRLYPVVKCAQCGAQLCMPECSQHIDEYRVRHIWKCEPCSYSFETTICLATQRGRRRTDRQQQPFAKTLWP
jgi:hypothetical protein